MIFFELNLTKTLKRVENRDRYDLIPVHMGLKNLAGAAALATVLNGGAEAQESQDNIALASAENSNPAVVLVLENYQACVEKVTTRAAKKENPVLREKIFMGGMKGCDRRQGAQMGIVEAVQTQAELEAEMAAMTAAVIQGAKDELGI